MAILHLLNPPSHEPHHVDRHEEHDVSLKRKRLVPARAIPLQLEGWQMSEGFTGIDRVNDNVGRWATTA
jgi:hypothetical protein